MAQPRKPYCPVPGCTELKKQRADGTSYGYCGYHMYKSNRIRDKAAQQNGHVEIQAEATRDEFDLPSSDQPLRILILNLDTNRAQSYDVLRETPCRAIVPQEPEAYGRFIRGAQEAGYTVVIQAGEA